MADVFNYLPVPNSGILLEIQRHFIERTRDTEAVYDTLLMVGVIVGVIFLVMLILHFRPKKAFIPQDWVVDPQSVRELLQTALSQRAKIELHFASEGDTRRPAMRCSPLALEKDTFRMEVAGGAALSHSWQGRNADCFFILRKRDSHEFYFFSAEILEVRTIKEACFVRLKIPRKIESRQKRSYLRISPPEEYTLGAGLWRGLDMPESLERNDLSLWPKPSRIWLPGVSEEFSIRDISSGGFRLRLPRHILAEEMDFVHVSSQFILMLDLWEPDKAQRLRFWLLCRMQSPVLDFESKSMDVGSQFMAWAKPADAGSSNLLWFKLASSGEVEPLGNWIMRRHLELFRETEQSLSFAQKQTV